MDSDYEDLEINFRDAGFARSMLESRENLSVLVQRDPDSIIVADLDGHAVGNVYFLKTGDAAYGYNLAIRKSHRKKGIARHLLGRGEDILRNNHMKKIHFKADGNRPDLHEYYQRLGYAPTGKIIRIPYMIEMAKLL